MHKRVVITGIGVLTSIGIGKDAYWEGLAQGKSGLEEITSFDTSLYKSKIGGEIKNFISENHFTPKELKKMDRISQLAVVAAREAVKDAGIEECIKKEPFKIGIVLGTLSGPFLTICKFHSILIKEGIVKARNFHLEEKDTDCHALADYVALEFGVKGPKSVINTACASGTNAIGYAFDFIRYGWTDIMITGGVDVITETIHGGFNVLKSLTIEKCRPFDKNRTGFAVGEASGILILESLEFALKRKAHIYGEVAGYGLSNDAYHMSAPHPDGKGAEMAMKFALDDARISIQDVDYINAHGTATLHNDRMETMAIKTVFKDHAYKIPVSSIKSMIGHTCGAAGAVEAIASIMAIYKGIIPPTINYETPDPECDLDYVPNNAREMKINVVLSNSFAFSGNNASIIFKKYLK